MSEKPTYQSGTSEISNMSSSLMLPKGEETMNVSVRLLGSLADKRIREHAQSRAAVALGRFQARITKVVVKLEDLNGPKGGVDKRCVIELTGSFGERIAEARDESFEVAINRGFSIIQRSLVRLIKRSGRAYGVA
jgi:hypothetical protein